MAYMHSEKAPFSSSSSSSSSTPRMKYDIFLSFRGEDTRNGFTSHLYNALEQNGIFTFMDNEKLERGKSISPELLKAIKKSKFAIIIFSKNYASSTWCLHELEKIIGCIDKTGMKVFPVFYDIDPSDVRKQEGTFAKAFVEHEKENMEKVQTWRVALRKVANLSGWHLRDRSEVEVIQEIVQVIFDKLRHTHTFLVDIEKLVGINSRVEQLEPHLAIGSNDVRIVGIWGIGGMGKTTLAKVVYNKISSQFEACGFIDDVRVKNEKYGLPGLQKELLKQLLICKDIDKKDVNDIDLMLENRLRDKKILLVLDDVNESKQLDKLVGSPNWFGLGSRVIITTREEHLLETHEVNEKYEVEALNNDEALQLFSLKAFKKDRSFVEHVELSQAFVHYSKGLPLALEALGSLLFNRSIDEWKSKLDSLKDFPEKGILDVLKISFDGLQAKERKIFLNIACFFNHMYQDDVNEILDCLQLYPTDGLGVLIGKSLIKLDNKILRMHDLLQEMGRDVVRQEYFNDPGKRSRLWLYKDIDAVLTKNTGTEAVESIVLKLSELKKVYWDNEAFSKMKYLKLLQIHGAQLMHDPKHLPNSLRVLDWSEYPSKSLPLSFQSNELVKLCLDYSKIEQLWKGTKSFGSLKFIKLNGSQKLIETPDFTEVPVLEKLDLEDCISLCQIHPSIGVLKKLTLLNLKGCKNLRSLSKKFAMESLEILILSGCSKLKKIPEFEVNMKQVLKLYLDGTAITKLPTSIENLTGLASLSARDCKNLMSLPITFFDMKSIKDVDFSGCSQLWTVESVKEFDKSGTSIRPIFSSNAPFKTLKKLAFGRFKPRSPCPMGLLSTSQLCWTSLIKLNLRNCNLSNCNLRVIPDDIGGLFSLERMCLSGNSFVCLPESIGQLSNLTWMDLDNCTSLRSLPNLPINIDYVRGFGCTSLEIVPNLLKPNSSCEPRIYFTDCPKLAENQTCIDIFLARIKKHHQGLTFEERYDTLHFEERYDIIFPGSEIPKWFIHQSTGNKVIIKEPSHLCSEWMGIAVCAVFCSRPHHQIHRSDYVYCELIANGKRTYGGPNTSNIVVLSDHVWLLYLPRQHYNHLIKSLWKSDANGFSHIGIRFGTRHSSFEVKKSGLRMVYKKDIDDLNQTMAQSSNNSIIPYEGLDVLQHNFDISAAVVEGNNAKRTYGDCDGAGPSGEGSSHDIPNPKMIERHTETHGNSDSEESSEYKDCDEELSDRDESNDDWEEDNDDSDEDDWEGDNDDSDESSVDRGKYSESDLDD